MAAVIKTVKPAGGGDYTLLSTWEAAADGASTTADPWWAECYSGGDLGKVTIAGFADPPTAEAHRVKIYAATGEGHGGDWATGAYTSSGLSGYEFTVQVSFITIDGLRIQNTHVGGGGVRTTNTSISDLIVENCLIENTQASATSFGVNFSGGQTYTNVQARNCIVRNYWKNFQLRCTNNTFSGQVYNCISYNGQVNGFFLERTNGTATMQMTNCIAMATVPAESDFGVVGTITLTTDNCLSEDGTADDNGGSDHLVDKAIANVFTDAAGGDFTHAASGLGIDAGYDLGATVSTDILGTARPQGSAYDMGAYEKATAGPPSGSLCTLFTGI